MSGRHDVAAELHRVLVVREGKVVEDGDSADTRYEDCEQKNREKTKERLSAAQRAQCRPGMGEHRTQPGCEAVPQQATGGKQEKRVPEPEVDFAW